MNYQTASEKLTGRNRDRRKLENNTYLERRNEDIVVRLHSTDIITFKPNGDTVLNSGGWRTVTTKERLNGYAPISIGQKNGQWLVQKRNPAYIGWEETPNVPYWLTVGLYADGLTVKANGTIKGITPVKNLSNALKLRKQVNKYAADYIKAFIAGKVPAPSGADCWHCSMRETKEGDGMVTKYGVLHRDGKLTNTANVAFGTSGKTMGEIGGDRNHILSHIREKYYVPSLLARAFEVMPHSPVMGYAIAEKWGHDKEKTAFGVDFVYKQLQKSLSRYMLRQLGQGA